MKILVLLLVVVGGAAGAAYFLKLGPFEETALTDTPGGAAAVAAAGGGAVDPCAPATAGTGGTAGTPAPTDPSTSGTAPADPAAVDPSLPATTPTASGSGSGTMLLASGDDLSGYASDSSILADETTNAVDPTTGEPIPGAADPATTDPAAAGDGTQPITPVSGSVDPSTGVPTDPNAATGSVPGATDPGAAGGTGSTGTGSVVDPCAPGADGAGATGGSGGSGATATSGNSASLMVDTSSGNNVAAVALGQEVAKIATKNGFSFEIDATLVPATGGTTSSGATFKRYSRLVTAGALRVRVTDAEAMSRWSSSKKALRSQYITNLLKLIRKSYPNASASVTMVSDQNLVIGSGDQTSGGRARVVVVK